MTPAQPSPSRVSPRVELARAKVNLALHITGQRPDGYHLLESLVVFPQIGDRIALEPSDRLELVVEGPFARDLKGPSEDNLILKSVRAFAERAGLPPPTVRLTLTKRLPVASGIGGGSSDAATALRLVEDFTGIYLDDADLYALALSLGADVPVCMYPEPQIMRGIGEELEPGPDLPACGIVLVNPKVGVSTAEAFKAMDRRDNPPMPLVPESFDTLDQLTGYLAGCRNDMQDAAVGVCSAIGDVLSALEADDRVELARMSGSGATCFALCEVMNALDIERELRNGHPEWWIASGPLS
ncbi:4-(cytidine 5'-diphospho)-2-C-methyl-D-erythritol kinase [Roseibium salinum]|uniref:4-diphosphocytidyl-2-C-methyl-D-erythritol kinase n=2 Tax=Roseibium salinum TaxID=1604349 RepID=A0ABT3QZD5_9HYPH|nr:4-(cytidine 5'-diphospho)-2-C-methyl-D-erythritol kinase [Roseibium sp. DSM 29163]MCX2722267.1 4-(cytidine 5'-diphospho)-2-C-methyl-D-erythritol kinase [Roseibium sp. DSM 29163]